MRARPSSADGVTSSDTLQAIAVYLDRHLAALKSDADGDLRRSRRDRAYNPDEISEWAVEDSHDLADLELL